MGKKMDVAMEELEAALNSVSNALEKIKKASKGKESWFDTVWEPAQAYIEDLKLRQAIWYGMLSDENLKRVIVAPEKQG